MATEVQERDSQTATEVKPQERMRAGVTYRPNVDIFETPDEITVLADLPGVAGEGIDIQFEKGVLTLNGRVETRWTENVSFLRREYGVGDFQRAFQIGEAVDASKIAAEFAHGVLTLHLPKVAAAKPRKIGIKTQ